MNKTLLAYSAITVAYIIVIVIYFMRRSRSHEKELAKFLSSAKGQLETHKVLAQQQANQKVAKAALVVKKVQEIAEAFETQAKEEYEQIILDAKQERKEILKSAKDEIAELFALAEKDLRDYREKRYQEIEKNLVKLVMAITGKVIGEVLDEKQHEQLIDKAIEEIKLQQQRTN